MKQATPQIMIVLIFLLLLPFWVYSQDIGIVNALIGYLNKPVPDDAQRVGRTEYSRLIQADETAFMYEIFETSNNVVIMATLKIVGNPAFINYSFGQMFNILDPLGEPIISSRRYSAWLYNDYIIIFQLSEDENIPSLLLLTFFRDDLELISRMLIF